MFRYGKLNFFRGAGHSGGRRNLEKEKDISMRFVTYLENDERKRTMRTTELRDIYRNEFSVDYEVEGVTFSGVLNCLCFHLNTCQQILGKVVFGGGQEATLVMFCSADEDDEREWEEESSNHSFPCDVCRKPMPTEFALRKHQTSINHRQQVIFREIRKSLERHDLINDKHGIVLTSFPQGDEAGVIETILKLGRSESIELTVKNMDRYSTVYVKDITLLWSTSLFDYGDIREIAPHKRTITPGCHVQFSIGCSPRKEYGYSYVPAVLRFQKDAQEFHILRFLCVRSVSDIFDELKKTSEYVGPSKHQPIPKDVSTYPGKNLPPLRQNGLRLERMEGYFILPGVRAQIKGSKQISRALSSKLEQPLTFSNYKGKFSDLIQVEELQMEKDIRNYDMEGVTFTKDPSDAGLLTLVVPGLAENRPSVLRGDRLFAYEQGARIQRFEGIVHRVEMLEVKLGFDESMPFIRNKKFDIQFTFNRMSIQMQHRSHERLVRNPGLESVVFPKPDTICNRGSIGLHFRGSGSFYDRNLNDEQKTAVENITNGTSRPAPYLIFGPPGTGKTVTFVEAIKQVFHNMDDAVILACAPENSAADLIAERLLPHISKHKILRMYATSRSWKFVPSVLKDVVNFDPLTKEVFYPTMEKMKQEYRVIVTTLVTAGRLVSANFGRDHFTHIFIDEAGHAVEPECIIPIADLLDPTTGQLVLAGDPKQLGPVLRSPLAQKYGLDMSLLERLMTTSDDVYKRDILSKEYNDKVMTKLVNNYRSHRDIIEVPKKLFYEDELNECAGDFRNVMLGWEELPNPRFPIIVHPVFGIDEREARSPSFFNVSEVETIEKYLKKLLDDNVRSRRMKMIKPEMIGIVTPYKRQVQKIQTMLEKRGYRDIKVGSVEEFQGQERRIIIISTVRSTKKEYLDMDKEFSLGFLDNPKRFNVAITRAQALLILIGNIEMLAKDENWGRFLNFCEHNNGIANVPRRDTGTDIASILERLRLMRVSREVAEECDISMKELQENPEWIRHE